MCLKIIYDEEKIKRECVKSFSEYMISNRLKNYMKIFKIKATYTINRGDSKNV